MLRPDGRPVRRCTARGSHLLEGRKIIRAYPLLPYSLSSDGGVLRGTSPSPRAPLTGTITKRLPQRGTGGIPRETPLWSGHGAPRVVRFWPGGWAALSPWARLQRPGAGAVRRQPAERGRGRPGLRGARPAAGRHCPVFVGPGREPRPPAWEPAFQRPSPVLPAEQWLPRWGLPGKEGCGTLSSPWGEEGRLRPKLKAACREALLAGTEAGAPPGLVQRSRRRPGEGAAGRGGGCPLGRLSFGGVPFSGPPVSPSTGPQWKQDEGTDGPSPGRLVRAGWGWACKRWVVALLRLIY